ncbi:MAG: restriction endonuclease subunit S [Spirochaetia bacterium]|nr:restriction endonuclease subunit S [Spirochaetia bacterium]
MALGLTPDQIIEKNKYPLLRIANNWERVKIDMLALIQNGYAFSSKFFTKDSGIPLIRIRDITNENTENLYSGEYQKEFVVNRGDMLIGMDGDFRVAKWRGEKGLLNQRVCRLIQYSNNYENAFLFLSMQPYLNAINQETSSVTVKHLSSNTIKQIPIPLPPLPEQRAIVAKIERLFSELDNAVENLKKALAQLKIYRQAVLKKAFEGELTKEWRAHNRRGGSRPSPTIMGENLLKQIKTERENYYNNQMAEWEKAVKKWEADKGPKDKKGKKPAKPSKPKELPPLTEDELAELPKLPEGWLWVPFITVNTIKSNLVSPEDFQSAPHIAPDNIQSNTGKLLKFRTISEDKVFSPKHYFYKGQIIYSKIRPYLNKLIIAKFDGLCSADMYPIESSYEIKFIFNLMLSKYFVTKASTSGSRTILPKINQTELARIPVPFCSTEEQTAIVAEIESRLSVCDKTEETIKENLAKAEALRQSILKKAFEGRLLSEEELTACRNEPDWEPAEKLLEKIKAERAVK